MCGLTGFIDLTRRTSADELRARVTTMADTLRHRGPDDAGVWVDEAAGVALGHRRLAILDLSPLGHQPMFSHDGHWCIAYNGEIYNHNELRRDLQQRGVQFKSTSDTETLVEGFAAWGVRETVTRCRGIFAIAAYDITKRELTLVRDHVGVKPMYYGRHGQHWFFGSELKALRAHPAFTAKIDRHVLPQFLRHNYIPAPYSIYENTWKLPAGTMLTLPVMDAAANPQPVPYWSFTETALSAVSDPWSGSTAEIVDRVQAELSRSVGEQMLSDVPLGAFLSGGIDSSLVVSLMQSQSPRPVKTFTIGFELADYNEAPFAAAVAKHLGTDHTEHYVTAEQARDVIPKLPAMFDEPFADSSQIPTFLVSELARRHVTVSLSGDGGDELFCGYLRYFAPLLGSKAGAIPTVIRSPLSYAVRLAGQLAMTSKSRKFLNRAASFLADADPDDRYLRGMSHWALNEFVVRDAHPVNTVFMERETWPKFAERQQRWMWLDTLNYLPDDILVKVDRTSMAVSLEARVPLLDPGVIAAAWRVPFAMQTQGWTGKQVLRSVLEKFVPRSLFERPKKGFGVPIAEWLRGPLRDWAEALLSEQRLQSEGYFHAAPIRQKWAEHQSGRVDRAYHLWDILMFQAWLEEVEG